MEAAALESVDDWLAAVVVHARDVGHKELQWADDLVSRAYGIHCKQCDFTWYLPLARLRASRGERADDVKVATRTHEGKDRLLRAILEHVGANRAGKRTAWNRLLDDDSVY